MRISDWSSDVCSSDLPALTPQLDVLRAVARDQRETHRFEHRLENALFGRRKFDEFKAVEAQRIFEEVGHVAFPSSFNCNYYDGMGSLSKCGHRSEEHTSELQL